ncbi:hypothetical protein CHS0354_021888, partial [Potamilus streckersoni]
MTGHINMINIKKTHIITLYPLNNSDITQAVRYEHVTTAVSEKIPLAGCIMNDRRCKHE